ncbi:hypothetical protein Dimus_005314 [Dionaea muscipula]
MPADHIEVFGLLHTYCPHVVFKVWVPAWEIASQKRCCPHGPCFIEEMPAWSRSRPPLALPVVTSRCRCSTAWGEEVAASPRLVCSPTPPLAEGGARKPSVAHTGITQIILEQVPPLHGQRTAEQISPLPDYGATGQISPLLGQRATGQISPPPSHGATGQISPLPGHGATGQISPLLSHGVAGQISSLPDQSAPSISVLCPAKVRRVYQSSA